MNRKTLHSGITALLTVALVLSMAVVGSAAVASRDWAWPVPDSNRLSSCFGDGRGHNAIDIAAPKGTNVVAAYDGKVVRTFTGCTCNYSKSGNCPCGSCGNLGNYVYIEHTYGGKTYVSRYGHLTKVSVSVGQTVKKGQVIGTVGSTGRSTGNHLDFQIYEGTYSSRVRYVDPLKEPFLDPPDGLNANASGSNCCYTYVSAVLRIIANEQSYLDLCNMTDPVFTEGFAASDVSVMSFPCEASVFSASSVVGKLKSGEEFTVLKNVVNSKDEQWLKITTASGVSGYVPADKTLSSSIGYGVAETVVSSAVTSYRLPDKSSSRATYSAGSPILIDSYLRDAKDALWYHTDDGYYIPAESLGEVTYVSSLKIEGTPYPYGNLSYGKSYSLSGTISSENAITNLHAAVYDTSGNEILANTVSSYGKSYKVAKSELDNGISFGKLPKGTYSYVLTITEAAQAPDGNLLFDTVLRSTFAVGYDHTSVVSVTDPNGGISSLSIGGTYSTFSNRDRISISSYNAPDSLTQGRSFSIKGLIVSMDSYIQDVTVSIRDSRGSVVQSKTMTPKSISFNLTKIDSFIKFGTLPVGTYVYEVSATNSSYTATLVSKPFTVNSKNQLFVIGSLLNFTSKRQYDDRFTDVADTAWYHDTVVRAYEMQLVNGESDKIFNPSGNITIAECITLAVNLRNEYYNFKPVANTSGPWYSAGVKYALENGIITHEYENYNAPITRGEAALIMAAALPMDAYIPINLIPDGRVPDVPADAEYYDAVYKLYRAGIVTGMNDKHEFAPETYITRAEMTALAVHIASPDMRGWFIF